MISGRIVLNRGESIMIKGILFCVLCALPCWGLGMVFPVIGGPVFAILLGMVLALIFKPSQDLQKGIRYTSKKILQLAVILLGFGLNLLEVVRVGVSSLPIIIATISTSLIVSFILCKKMKIHKDISILVGVGSSICGGSAIAATAPVIEADDEDVAQAISVIFLFNIIAALLFPTLGSLLHLSNEGFGLFAGTAINDTSSVTAAAAAWDGMHANANTLDQATIVKLTRTLAIIPITLSLAFWQMKEKKRETSTFSFGKVFPFFVLFFVAASIITTICVSMGIDASYFSFFKEVSKFFIIMAMFAIGINTNIVSLIKTGGKPIIMGASCWFMISIVSLGLQYILNLT